MRILILTSNYPPEKQPWGIKFAELAQAWRSRGHEVTVMTGYPFWPEGVVHAGYHKKWRMIEELDGIRVVRVWHHTSQVNNFIHRTLTFLTMSLNMRWAGRKIGPFDLIYAAVPPPTIATAGISLARHFKCPSVIDIEDIHPDASIDSGFITNPALIAYLRWQERWIYRNATVLCPLGKHFHTRLSAKGVPEEKLHTIWNWIDTEEIRPQPRENELRREWGIDPDRFVVLYAGTMGRQHGTSVLVDVADKLKNNKDLLFLFVGLGVERTPNEEKAKELGLTNVMFHDFVPRARLAEMQALSDVSVVTLLPGRGHSSNPSKLLGYLAAERPVIASVQADCDAAAIVREAEAGVIVEPGNSEKLLESVEMMRKSPENRKNWAINGRKWVEKTASLSSLGDMAEGILNAALGQKV